MLKLTLLISYTIVFTGTICLRGSDQKQPQQQGALSPHAQQYAQECANRRLEIIQRHLAEKDQCLLGLLSSSQLAMLYYKICCNDTSAQVSQALREYAIANQPTSADLPPSNPDKRPCHCNPAPDLRKEHRRLVNKNGYP